MDDDLVLNLAAPTNNASQKAARTTKKGGRWTDRLKAKRSNKRKSREEEKSNNIPVASSDSLRERPAKKARIEQHSTKANANSGNDARPAPVGRPNQIISSLFSYNPKVDAPVTKKAQSLPSAPSNAPLADSSDFGGLGLHPLLIAHLQKKLGIIKPTSIQRSALPVLLRSTDERDVFIQAQTGSGKTFSFLLPIIQDLLPLSSLSYIDRSIGTLAIIIAPTRELAQQISDVLEKLLQLRLRPEDESADDETASARLTRWLVSGVLTGGATRTHEKARLRKGLPILVSTPGRLLDHLQNTSSFNVGKCRWLVLDEADRLMDLGFEETVKGILQGLEGRRKLALTAIESGNSMEVGGWDWDRRRRTVLCSATIEENVQKLAGMTLANPIVIKALTSDRDPESKHPISGEGQPETTKFTPPSQLTQKYVVVPLKLRLVALVALLRSLVAQSAGRRSVKIIVFLSCTDSVDFHWTLLGKANMDDEGNNAEEADKATGSDSDSDGAKEEKELEEIFVQSPLIPDTSIYRLHGSLPTPTRLASLKGFSEVPKKIGGTQSASILLCTSVAARGLDLPLVRAVVQYDLPTEGGETEYVHRVGRTARAGKGGEAWSFVAPSESEWVNWVQGRMASQGDGDDGKASSSLVAEGVDDILKSGFGGSGSEFEQRATEVQLSFERWVLRMKENSTLARKAYLSHMRAYATHPSNEKHIFHIRNLHLGHLAKAFALRDAPTAVTSGKGPIGKTKQKKTMGHKGSKERSARRHGRDVDDDEDSLKGEAEKRMQAVVRAQGRLTKEKGAMVSKGVSEFQIAGGYDLEKLVGSF